MVEAKSFLAQKEGLMITTQIGRKGRNLQIILPANMTVRERKKTVSELFAVIRSIQGAR